MKRFLLTLALLVTNVLADTFVEVRNADGEVLREIPDLASDWEAPPQKFGPDKPTQFLRLVTTERPAVDERVFTLTPITIISTGEAIRSWTTNRLPTTNIVQNIRSEAQRRVNALVSQADAITILGAIAEIHDRQLSGTNWIAQSTLEAADQATLVSTRALWARAKAIRGRARELIAQADTVTELGGWPE